MIKLRSTISLLFCFGIAWTVSNIALAAEQNKTPDKNLGKTTYMANCEACHMMGKNVLKPGKDIIVSSKLTSLDEFKEFLSEKHGLMPAFKSIADNPEVVDALYKFTKKLKKQNWTYEPPLEEAPPENSPAPPEKKHGDKDSRPTG